MKPLTVHLRQGAHGSIEACIGDDATAWRPTGMSPDMKLEGRSIEDLRSFLYEMLDLRTLEEMTLRLSDQRKIGRQLHRSLFGTLEEEPDFGQWVHFVPVVAAGSDAATRDASADFVSFVSRVPWTLLTRADDDSASFLVLDEIEPVAITVDGAPERQKAEWSQSIKMPPFPRVLLVIPHVLEGTSTQGEEHEQELLAVLQPYLSRQSAEQCLLVVRTFAEFEAAIAGGQLEPHIVYFYGHGLSRGHGTSFQFQGPLGEADWHSFDDIRAALDRLVQRTRVPPVVWVNACLGGAAERDSAVQLLSPIACCVITTRTLAAVTDARSLAVAALPLIVIDGQSPPGAVRNALHSRPLPIRSARWASTIISVQYDSWTALALAERSAADLDSAGDFPMRLDRAEPLERVAQHLAGRLAAAPSPSPILWHAQQEQGVEVFEELMEERVQERFPTWNVRRRPVDLEPDQAPGKSLARRQHFLKSLFCALSPRAVVPTKVDAARLRGLLKNLGGERTVVLLSHGPFDETNVRLVQDYAAFWQELFSAIVPEGMHVVLGFGMHEGAAWVAPQLGDALIQPLGAVPPRELAKHLAVYHLLYSINQDKAPVKAQEMVDAHGGRFDRIRRELEQLAGIRPDD